MALKEEIIFPTAHPQEDLAQRRQVMPIMRIDRNLRCRTGRQLITEHVVLNVDNGDGPPRARRINIRQTSSCLKLTACDRILNESYFSLKNATWYRIEGN